MIDLLIFFKKKEFLGFFDVFVIWDVLIILFFFFFFSFFFDFLIFFSFHFSIRFFCSVHLDRSKVTRVTVGRDTDQPTKVFEFVKLILRP